MQGTIKLIEQKTSTNGKPYGSITMESGDRYTCYDAQIYQQIKAGETIEFEPNVKTVNGKTYKRIESCTVLAAAAPEPPKTELKASVPQQVAPQWHPVDNRSGDILFGQAVNQACEMWRHGHPGHYLVEHPEGLEEINGLILEMYKGWLTLRKAL